MTYKWPQKEDALEPGIYFGMDDTLYHSDSALSRSGIGQLLLDTPFEFWINSWMNEALTHPDTSDAMKWGSQFHMLLLEPKLFTEKYFVYPGESYDESREMIKSDDYQTMKNAIKVLRSLEAANDLLVGGEPEVTFVWPDRVTGLMLRARVDYLKPYAIVDLKTTFTLRAIALQRQFRDHLYHVQNAMYTEGMTVIKDMLRNNTCDIYGDVDNEWLKKFIEDDNNHFAFVLQKKKFPHPAEVIFPLAEHNIEKGYELMRKGIDKYIYYMEAYKKKPWPVSEGKYRTFSLEYGYADEEGQQW